MYFEEFQKSSFTTTGITLAACEILARSTGEYKAYTSKDVCLNGDYEVTITRKYPVYKNKKDTVLKNRNSLLYSFFTPIRPKDIKLLLLASK